MITPELDQCTLDFEDRTLKPIRIYPSNRLELVVQGFQIEIEINEIRALQVGDEKLQWTTKVPDEIELNLLANDEKVLYFAGFHIDEKSKRPQPESPLRVCRLEIATGKWLDDLPLETKPDPKQSEYIQSVLCANNCIVILIRIADKEPTRDQTVSYRIVCFQFDEMKPIWSKSFSSVEKLYRLGVFLLQAARSPAKVQPDVQSLTQIGDDILVCADPVQSILCLEGNSGKEHWRMERLWEYERGFIGPSVWRHFINRFGRDSFEEEKTPTTTRSRKSLVDTPSWVDPWLFVYLKLISKRKIEEFLWRLPRDQCNIRNTSPIALCMN
jgi:hypothetical protein